MKTFDVASIFHLPMPLSHPLIPADARFLTFCTAFSASVQRHGRSIVTASAHLLRRPYEPSEVEPRWRTHWEVAKDQAPSVVSAAASNASKEVSFKDQKKKFYSLSMFPYPSGVLHIGHARVYTISDLLARAHRLAQHEVLHPMGWDAFGLPAENAAVERGENPATWTRKNIAQMKVQMKYLGFDFDWKDSEVATCDPSYYKWTQWLFTKLYDAGLAYQRESYVNYDPVDKTVLANEQVDSQGKSWRSGAVVEKRLMKQWYFKITDYAEPLLNDITTKLDSWPDRVKKQQIEWIGRNDGASIDFSLAPPQHMTTIKMEGPQGIQVFTTRPDTLLGCTFLVIAPESPLVKDIADPALNDAIQVFVKETLAIDFATRMDGRRQKKGMFIGRHVVHPISGDLLPVYIADYVVADYATGAVMGVPAHDSRDFAFANEYKLPIKQVVELASKDSTADSQASQSSQDASSTPKLPIIKQGEGTRLINSGKYDGMTTKQAADAMVAENMSFLKPEVQYNLRDWLVSRQRYWGAPIPIIHCDSCGTVPVPEKDLPVVLPDIDFKKAKESGLNAAAGSSEVDFEKGKGSPLALVDSFVHCSCPKCGSTNARRETDTMDTFVDSSWYFMRYPDAQNESQVFSPESAQKWLPVDLYVGGVEHAILHLLYARFINKFMFDEGYVPASEPFTTLRTQGMVHGKTFRIPGSDRPVPSDSVVEKPDGTATHAETGQLLDVTWEKMSKSKYNGVDPVAIVNEYGADTIRLFLLFKAPVDQVLDWDTNQIVGQLRWIRRVWSLVQHWKLYQYNKKHAKKHGESDMLIGEAVVEGQSSNASFPSHAAGNPVKIENLEKRHMHLRHVVHETVRSVTTSVFETHAFNVAIAKLMTLSNELRDIASLGCEQLGRTFDENALMDSPEFELGLRNLLVMLSPMAPHFASEAWLLLNTDIAAETLTTPSATDCNVLQQVWPTFNEEYLEPVDLNSSNAKVHVHIGGKQRAELVIPEGLDENQLKEFILSAPQLKKYLDGKSVTKFVHVPNKQMVNLVVK